MFLTGLSRFSLQVQQAVQYTYLYRCVAALLQQRMDGEPDYADYSYDYADDRTGDSEDSDASDKS